MSSLVIDTHTLLWYVSDSAKLSASALSFLVNAERNGESIYVPSISLVEIRYLVEKGKDVQESDFQTILSLLRAGNSALKLAPLNLDVAESLVQIPRALVPDMPDRIIAATALALGLPLATRDSKIQALSNIKIIW